MNCCMSVYCFLLLPLFVVVVIVVLGGEGQMFQHFHGYLAGLTLLKNRAESEQVIQCLTSCQERLDFSAVDLMETGMVIQGSLRLLFV